MPKTHKIVVLNAKYNYSVPNLDALSHKSLTSKKLEKHRQFKDEMQHLEIFA